MLNVFFYLNKEEKWKQTTGQDEDENMKIIETYGNYIEKWSNENPGRARWLLKTGWKAQNLKFRFAPDKRLMPAEQYLARLMMDTMIRPLERPEESAIVSIFTPCEILQEAGLHPYNVEGFSCYLSASKAERAFLQQAENTGISETLCSYHKTFIGAAQKKVLPKPKCIVYTNLTCDANLLTFKKLAKMYDVPIFAIDVPMQQNEDNVQYVADQLRKLKDFIEECTGKKITDETLTERLRRSKRTLEKFAQYEKESADRYIPADLVTPLYAGMTNNLLLGTEEEETYVDRLLNDVKKLLAYSSIENIGIIFIALGSALLGKAEGSDPIFYAGMAGALLHTLNHSFFKSLLFMGAGNIYTATQTTSLDDLGGLGKRMPVTAILFLVGPLAICALPPLSGFVSEFLIYMGLLDGIAANGPVTVIALSGLIFLALIGGLAVLACTKLYGGGFSGLPRSEVAERAREVSRPMLAAMALPLAGILLVGLAPVFALRWIVGLVARIADVSGASPISVPADVLDRTVSFSDSFLPLTYGIGMLVGIFVILWLLRSWVVRRRTESSSPTWN